MKSIKQVSIFLASPGDVDEERKIVREVIEELNGSVAATHDLYFRIYGWETDTIPEYGDEPPAIVNKQTPSMSQYDLFIGIMWNRFGTPTSKADSGTEEEFNAAVDAFVEHGRPSIHFYFNQAPSSLGIEEMEQRKKVLNFSKQLKSQALLGSYDGARQFRDLFRKNMQQWLARMLVSVPAEPTLPSAAQETTSTAHTDEVREVNERWVLLDSHFLKLSNLAEPEANLVQLVVIAADAEEEAAMRSLRNDHAYNKKIINYAYDTEGGLAEVESVGLKIEEGQSTWTLALRRVDPSDSMSEITYNNKTPEMLATMRAKLILLNESIPSTDSMLDSFVRGFRNDITVPNDLLPALWKKLDGDERRFKVFARLWAVMYLKATNTCEQILQLDLGDVNDHKMAVKFRGLRKKRYSNEDAKIITVDGECRLS